MRGLCIKQSLVLIALHMLMQVTVCRVFPCSPAARYLNRQVKSSFGGQPFPVLSTSGLSGTHEIRASIRTISVYLPNPTIYNRECQVCRASSAKISSQLKFPAYLPEKEDTEGDTHDFCQRKTPPDIVDIPRQGQQPGAGNQHDELSADRNDQGIDTP